MNYTGFLSVRKSIVIILWFCLLQQMHANETQSLDILQQKIEHALISQLADSVDGKLVVTVEKMDSRLQLKQCKETALEVFNPYKRSLIQVSTMGIKCLEPDNHWILYVPVKLSLMKKIYAAKRTLVKGTRIEAGDIFSTEIDVHALRQGFYTKKKELLGHVCKQNIISGTAFSPANLQLPSLVRKGQTVNIKAGGEGFSVNMSGIALNEGAMGEIISVKNLSSKRTVEVRVTGKQEVQVGA